MGLFWQGLFHDLSKYSIQELSICKYWTGEGSPHQACRQTLGYSPSWLHHYHKNKHHFQYWWDDDEDGNIIPIKMPYKYVIESFCDMVGASKAYGESVDWKPSMVWDYWIDHCKNKRIMDIESSYLLEKLIWNFKEYGETRFFYWYKKCKGYLKERYEKGELKNEISHSY